jgi:membrane associated rhomboid family serine protease
MKAAGNIKEERHDSNLAFIGRVALLFLVIFLLMHWILSLRYLLFIIGSIIGVILVKIKSLWTGRSFSEILKGYITFIPYTYAENEWKLDGKIRATLTLIFLNVAVHYLLFFGPEYIHADILKSFAFIPLNKTFLNWLLSPLFATFLHSGHGHLWGNMIFLWAFGTVLERRIGWKRFVLLYLVTGICANLISAFLYYEFLGRAIFGVGASGAISGIMGVCIVRLYYKRMVIPLPILGFFSSIFPIGFKLRINSLIIIGLDFARDLSGWLGQLNGSDTRTDHPAHLAGLICGMIGALWLKLRRDTHEEKHLEKGLRILNKQSILHQGEEELERVLAMNPQNVTALLALAREHSRHKPTCRGYYYYNRVLKILIDTDPRQAADIFVEYLEYYTKCLDPELQYRLAARLVSGGRVAAGFRALELMLKNDSLPEDLRKKVLSHLALAAPPRSRIRYGTPSKPPNKPPHTPSKQA